MVPPLGGFTWNVPYLIFLAIVLFFILKFRSNKKEISTTFPRFQAIKDATGMYGNEAVKE
jgi:hypothetical protein